MKNSLQIANYFISKGIEENNLVSPMKLQKLLFYAFGWYYSLKNELLFNESIQAWKYGPVIESIYHRTKSYGSKDIDALLGMSSVDSSTAPLLQPHTDQEVLVFLQSVWTTLSKYSAVILSNATHSENSPWTKVYHEYKCNIPAKTSIPNQYIKAYFDHLISSSAASAKKSGTQLLSNVRTGSNLD